MTEQTVREALGEVESRCAYCGLPYRNRHHLSEDPAYSHRYLPPANAPEPRRPYLRLVTNPQVAPRTGVPA